MIESTAELLKLIDLQVEDRLNDQQQQRMVQLLQHDPALVKIYTEYLCLHGQLFWDAGLSAPSCLPAAAAVAADNNADNNLEPSVVTGRSPGEADFATPKRVARRSLAVAAGLAAMFSVWILLSPTAENPLDVADGLNEPGNSGSIAAVEGSGDDAAALGGGTELAMIEDAPDPDSGAELKPLELRNVPTPATVDVPDAAPVVLADRSVTSDLPPDFTDDMVVSRIDERLQASWDEQGVQHSAVATDAEWVRRVYLTFAGRVPTLPETESFLNDDGPRKRQQLLQDVTNDSQQASHLAVVWTNLLVGRTVRTGVNREKLFDFLFDQFDRNAPWIDTVNELITASGRNDENGATNFLLAHLNNEATPATAVTARLFLGEQISCVQCHDHPFAKDVQQQHYWALNAFFKDTDRVTAPVASAAADQRLTDTPWMLVDRPQRDRMTYYETRAGLKKAVLPRYDGKTLASDSQENRRQQLAAFLAADSEARVAKAMVNRMWNHFFGYGFTNPVDDMGPHAAVSHPDLLNVLTDAFVKSGYDIRRLMRWIASSQAWQLSSEATAENSVDNPAVGEVPLFSRVYVRRMTPEQVYESIRVAIRSAAGQLVDDGEVHSRHRREWVRQFAQAYNTDENDESLDFDGTISQALVMMNGLEVDTAIRQATAAILNRSRAQSGSGIGSLKLVALAMVNREPTSQEETVFRRHLQHLRRQQPAVALSTAVEDMMWAYLNSSEFMLVH